MSERMKWCAGSCGRQLPLSDFYVNRHGNPQGKCKACHRIVARKSYGRRYRNDSEFRQSERDRKRTAYVPVAKVAA